MKKLMKVLLSLILLVVAFGCQASKEPSTGEKKTEINVALGGKPSDMDPVLCGDAISNYVQVQLYEGLYRYQKDGSATKRLAKETVVSDDGLTYTITIVDDALWSDGQPVTAHDFEYGVKRILHMANTAGSDASYMQLITDYVAGAQEARDQDLSVAQMNDVGYKALDDHTIQITLKKVTPYYEQLLANGVYYPARADFALETGDMTWGNSADCPYNGPFKVQSVDTDSQIVLVKNDQYRFASDVELTKVTFKVMEDMEAQFAAFQTGEIDFATSVNTETVLTYENQDAVWSIDPFIVNYYVMINAKNTSESVNGEALKDVRVRQALSYAADRQAILKAAGAGDYYYELNGFLPKGIPDPAGGDFRENADKEEKYATYDLEKAKQLLKEAGYDESHPLKLEYYYNQSTMHNTAAESIQASWKLAGIDVELKTNDISSFFSERASGTYEIARGAMSADYPDPNAYLDMYLTATQNTVTVGDAHYDELVERANKETDPVKRSELLHEAEHYLVAEQMYVIPLFGYGEPWLLNPRFKNVTSSPNGSFYLETARYE